MWLGSLDGEGERGSSESEERRGEGKDLTFIAPDRTVLGMTLA